ncbi:MAG: Ferredoxin reductase [candidate division TM6 bacterium GW2011_GWF2_33_332]|nr:MAG: Ferredoxin reductase [candidate division TM6 bacterium GW2011_GWF2_33_332]
MKQFTVKIQSIQQLTHNVIQIITEKPPNLTYTPGQATDVSISKSGWKEKKRPFTFTSLPDSNFLEFIIKTYPLHKGVTNEILRLKINEELILHDVFGAIAYKGEGVFIAGGAGVTPYICIFRDLHSRKEIGDNKLIFANKKKKDIIHEEELINILGKNFINILSDEKVDGYAHGQITESFLKSHISTSTKNIYICGPPSMMEAVEKQLIHLEIDKKQIIKEAF